MKNKAIKNCIAIFTDRFVEVSNDVARNFQMIGKRWGAGDIVYRSDEIKRLLDLDAPIELYVKAEQPHDVDGSAKSRCP